MGSTAAKRPFYFLATFWGRTYVDYFLDFCLASLLAPGNIPALMAAGWPCRVIICTPPADVEYLKGRPFFRDISARIPVDFIEFAGPLANEGKMLTMSRGHMALSTRAHDDRALAVYLTPDMIFSDQSMACVRRAAEDGVRALLVPAIRYAHEAVVERFAKEGTRIGGVALAVPARRLAAIGLESLHTETLRYEYDKPWFSTFPIGVFWRTQAGDGMVLYTFSWAPMLLDYGALEDGHDQSTFENWTMDGDYVHRNFKRAEDMRVVSDSDELMLVTLTRESDLSYELKPIRIMRWNLARKLAIARCYWYVTMDSLKRRIFPTPCLIHGGEPGPELLALRERTRRLIRSSTLNPLIVAAALTLIVLDRRTYRPFIMEHAPFVLTAYRRVRDFWCGPLPGQGR